MNMKAYEQVLFDVDTQFDFLDPGGNLEVPEAETILPMLERLFDFAKRSGFPVISTADSHSAHDPEFEQFGRHCEVGTLGQHKLPFTVLPRSFAIHAADSLPDGPAPLLREYQQLIFHKDNLDVFVNPYLGKLVETLDAEEYVVFGVATEYCIATAVEGLLARNARVLLVTDAIGAIDKQKGEQVLASFAERGVRFVRTAEIVHPIDDPTPPADDEDEDI